MGSPYTSQAISGYNTSPPPDDGSAVTANALKWSNHKDKLADPIKTLTESINTQLVAAFGKIFGADFDTKSANYTITAADQGQFLLMDTGATTFTLPAVGSLGAGFAIALLNTSTGVVTVDGNSSETINGATTLTLLPNDFVILTADGSTWAAIGDTNNSSGTFVPTFIGFSADPGGPNVDWNIRNGIATVQFRFTQGTSDAVGFQIDNWPAALLTSAVFEVPISGLVDNGSAITGWGAVSLPAAGAVLTFYSDAAASGWTGSGSKGLTSATGTVISYPLLVP